MSEIANMFVTIGSKFDATGLNKAVETVNDFNKKMENVSSGLNKAGAVLTGFAVAGVASLTKMAKLAIDNEEATSKLAQAMKQAGTFTAEALAHNIAYAESLMKITTADDEQILAVQKVLTNFGVQGEMLDRLTKATLDFATAKGIDYVSAGQLLAKTVGSENNALARYGIEVKGAEGSTRRMEDAVNGITRLFGGSAQAEAETFAGRIKQLQVRFDELFEVAGKYLLPTLDKFITTIGNLISKFENLPESLKEIIVNFVLWGTLLASGAGAILLFAGNIATLVIAFIQLQGVIKATNAILGTAGFIGLCIAGATAVLALTDAIGGWIDKSAKAKEEEAKLYTTELGMIKSLEERKKILQDKLKNDDLDVKQTAEVNREYERHTKHIKEIKEAIAEKERQRTKSAKVESKLSDKELKEMEEIYDLKVKLTRKEKKMNDEALREQAQFLLQQFAMSEDGSLRQLQIFDKMQVNRQMMQDNANLTFSGAMTNFYNNLATQAVNYGTILTNIQTAITDAVSASLMQMYTEGVDTWDKFSKVADTLWQSIKMAVLKQIADMVAQILVQYAILKVKAIANALVDIGISFATTAWKLISGWASIPFVGWALGLGAVAVARNEYMAYENRLRSMATGGLAMSPTMAVVGDAGIGNPEAVLPLKSPETARLLGDAMARSETSIGGNTLNITVPYMAIPDKRNAKKMAKVIGNELANNLFNNRKV